jgi:hypothetical protein
MVRSDKASASVCTYTDVHLETEWYCGSESKLHACLGGAKPTKDGFNVAV